MSKIICDVCGTSYPETATQCPICGCVRPGDVNVVAGDTTVHSEEKTVQNYTHVKGGRFSKANVRKRNSTRGIDTDQDVPVIDNEVDAEQQVPENKGKNKTDVALTVTVIALLLAIVAVVAYIVIRFFVPAVSDNDNSNETTKSQISTTISTEDPTTESTENVTDTTGETVNTEFHVDELVELSQVDETFQLAVVGVDEEEIIVFETDDDTIATVDENGVITAVSEGEVTIKVICGDKEVTCKVVISFSADATDPTEETEETTVPDEDTTVPTESVDLNYFISHEEVTLLTGVADRKTFQLELKDEEGNLVDVEWRDDKGLCKIDGNTITAESTGSTKIYAVIDGVKYPEYSCYIIIWYDA